MQSFKTESMQFVNHKAKKRTQANPKPVVSGEISVTRKHQKEESKSSTRLSDKLEAEGS